jgi:quinol monooxygenase YgiN
MFCIILLVNKSSIRGKCGETETSKQNRGGEIMAQLTIVANITAKADKIDLVKAELEKLIPITRAEEGCLQYDLHQDKENPAHFLFYENWESRELWQAHMGARHLQDYLAATEGAVEVFTVNEMTRLA